MEIMHTVGAQRIVESLLNLWWSAVMATHLINGIDKTQR